MSEGEREQQPETWGLLLRDYEAAGDALQILMPVLSYPRGGLWVTQAVRYFLHRLVVQHARLPRLLNGFQPVEYGRRYRDRILEPPRHTCSSFNYPMRS